MSDEEDLPVKPASKSLKTKNVSAFLDFKTIVLQHSKKNTSSSSDSVPLVNRTKKNLFVDPTKEEKKARKEQKEFLKRAERALNEEEEMKSREQKRKMEEKAKIYEKLNRGEQLVYEDGSKPEFLVDFDRRGRSRSRSRSPLPEKSKSAAVDFNYDSKHCDYNYDSKDYELEPGPSVPRQMEVYYNPAEEKDRFFGAAHIHLPQETDARQKKIDELMEMSLKTAEARVNFQKKEKQQRKEERAKINFMRELIGESPLPSEEEEEEEHPGANIDLNEIPLPPDPDAIVKAEEERKKKFVREWDKGKIREMTWIKERRDEPRSLPSTPADRPKKKDKFLKKSPLVKFPNDNAKKIFKKEDIETSSEDDEFVPSEASDEKMDLSEVELSQELAELADEASEFELMKRYHEMINEEEDALEEQKKSKEVKNPKKEAPKPKVYEEVSEDDDWATEDMDMEAFDLIKDQEEHEKEDKKGKKKSKEEQRLDGEDEEEMDKDVTRKHEAELKRVLEEDPEFAEFLKTEDTDLLDFGRQMEEEDEEEEEGEKDNRIPVTLEMIKEACKVFEDKNAQRGAIRKCVTFAVKAFIACMKRVSPNGPDSVYVVMTDQIFDQVIRMTFSYLSSAFLFLLEPIDESKKEKEEDNDDDSESESLPLKDKKSKDSKPRFRYWKQCHVLVRQFCVSLNLFLMEIPSDNILNACLRAVIDNSNLFVQIEKIAKNLIKNLVRIWSRKGHESRCLAFVILCKLIRFNPDLFPIIYKSCYVAYVANTRSISLQSLPVVAFMQKSFAELSFMEPSVAYQYAFVYIRQCAIHLRNATIAKKKDLIKTVYNWQYIQCLYLWTQVMSLLNTRRAMTQEGGRLLRDLIHPLIQVICGAMKAFNAHRYVPLKAHCVRMLLKIQMNCNVYVPTMAYSVDLLNDLVKIDSKKPKKGKGAARPSEMQELIKFNVDMLEDGIYRDKLATEIRSLVIEAAYINRGSVAFADIYAPLNHQFRKFLKEYKNPNILPLMKSTFQVIQHHAQKVQELLNTHGIDLESQMDSQEFAKAVDKSTDELVKVRALLKKRIEAAAVPPKEKDAKGKKTLLENETPPKWDREEEQAVLQEIEI
ncbi:hypothetical protein FO519_007401 [Halicephalobus sp. NKZ332]|nr:hypothetical protein FO519_007401 [Halicephalobus sp. NKZ332]